MKNVRIGDILIEYGYITADQLDKALAYQKEHPELRIGQALQALGFVSEKQVLEALGEEELTGMILNLREPYCTPCRLVLLEQHTMAEAARLCGRPLKTVEAQVYRAKKMLAQQILQNDRVPCERSVHGTV